MKYSIALISLFLLLNTPSKAQLNKLALSSSFQFNSASKSVSTSQDDINSQFEIVPRITYQLNNKFGIGLFYSYAFGKNTISYQIPFAASNQMGYSTKQSTIKTYGHAGGAFVQYYLLNSVKFKVFSELDAGYGIIQTSDINISGVESIDPNIDRWHPFQQNNNPSSLILPTPDLRTIKTFNYTPDSKFWSSSINIGGRYNFYKGLGTEVRLNNLVNYSNLTVEDNPSISQINIFKNFFNNISIGLSYQF